MKMYFVFQEPLQLQKDAEGRFIQPTQAEVQEYVARMLSTSESDEFFAVRTEKAAKKIANEYDPERADSEIFPVVAFELAEGIKKLPNSQKQVLKFNAAADKQFQVTGYWVNKADMAKLDEVLFDAEFVEAPAASVEAPAASVEAPVAPAAPEAPAKPGFFRRMANNAVALASWVYNKAASAASWAYNTAASAVSWVYNTAVSAVSWTYNKAKSLVTKENGVLAAAFAAATAATFYIGGPAMLGIAAVTTLGQVLASAAIVGGLYALYLGVDAALSYMFPSQTADAKAAVANLSAKAKDTAVSAFNTAKNGVKYGVNASIDALDNAVNYVASLFSSKEEAAAAVAQANSEVDPEVKVKFDAVMKELVEKHGQKAEENNDADVDPAQPVTPAAKQARTKRNDGMDPSNIIDSPRRPRA